MINFKINLHLLPGHVLIRRVFSVLIILHFTCCLVNAKEIYNVSNFAELSAVVFSKTTAEITIIILAPISCRNLNIPNNMHLVIENNGEIDVSEKLIINGNFTAPLKHVFKGLGKVHLANSSVIKSNTIWFGAKGDAYNDDTSAIERTLHSHNNILVNGVSLISRQLNIDKSIALKGRFILAKDFIVNKCVFCVTGDNSSLKLNIDFNANGITGILDKSNGTKIDIIASNLIAKKVSTNGFQSVVNSVGKNSIVNIKASNITKGTSDNDSVPRLWTTDTGATGNVAQSITGTNINLGWCEASSGNRAEKIILDNVFDNGIYIVGHKSNSVCEYLEISNSVNVEGFVIEGNGFRLDHVVIKKSSGSSGIQNATDVIINKYELIDCLRYVPLRSRVGNKLSDITINNLSANVDMVTSKNGAALFQFVVGDVNLTLINMDVTLHYLNESTKTIINWKKSDKLFIKVFKLTLKDNTFKLSENDIFYLNFPTNSSNYEIKYPTLSINNGAQIRLYALPKTIKVSHTHFNGNYIDMLIFDSKKL